jgi:hypothetical protein
MFTRIIIIFLTIALAQSQTFFESQGYTEMNKLNMNHLYAENQFILGYFSEGSECDQDCQEIISLLSETQKNLEERLEIKLVWINSDENRKLVKELRVIEVPSIAYMANKKVVIYDGEEDSKSLGTWIKKRVIMPSEPYSKSDDIDGIKNDWNIFVNYVGRRNKYYQAFRYVASSYSNLHFVHSFSAPVSPTLSNPLISRF